MPKEQNFRADLVSKLASSKRMGYNHTIIHESLATPSIEASEANIFEVS